MLGVAYIMEILYCIMKKYIVIQLLVLHGALLQCSPSTNAVIFPHFGPFSSRQYARERFPLTFNLWETFFLPHKWWVFDFKWWGYPDFECSKKRQILYEWSMVSQWELNNGEKRKSSVCSQLHFLWSHHLYKPYQRIRRSRHVKSRIFPPDIKAHTVIIPWKG